jgi:hypothetical protein
MEIQNTAEQVKTRKRKLVLKREALRELNQEELEGVAGGAGSNSIWGTCSLCWFFAEW